MQMCKFADMQITSSIHLHIRTFAYLHIMMNDQKDKTPLFKSWTHWYVLVIGVLILLIILFYWLTKTFA